MKTSILISSFAAFVMMMTFGESNLRNDSVSTNSTSLSEISIVRTSSAAMSHKKYSPAKEAANSSSAAQETDFSYLKFDVNYFIQEDANSANDITSPVNTSSETLDYLKFDVSKYESEKATASYDDTELPADHAGYLKFNVNHYSSKVQNSVDSEEMPSDEFSHLKFKVENYTSETNENPGYYDSVPAAE